MSSYELGDSGAIPIRPGIKSTSDQHSGNNGATSPPDPPGPPNMESRVTALETKWEAVIPTLATKSDLAEVRTDFAGLRAEFAELRADVRTQLADMNARMQEMNAGLKGWMLATLLAIIGVMIAFAGYLTNALKPAPAVAPAAQQPTVIVVPAAAAPAAATPPAAVAPPAAPASR